MRDRTDWSEKSGVVVNAVAGNRILAVLGDIFELRNIECGPPFGNSNRNRSFAVGSAACGGQLPGIPINGESLNGISSSIAHHHELTRGIHLHCPTRPG